MVSVLFPCVCPRCGRAYRGVAKSARCDDCRTLCLCPGCPKCRGKPCMAPTVKPRCPPCDLVRKKANQAKWVAKRSAWRGQRREEEA